MNREAILKTALLQREANGVCTVSSPLCSGVLGVGNSPEEAYRSFVSLVQDRYIAYLEGKLVGSQEKRERGRGRPRKSYVEFHTKIHPDVKSQLSGMADALGISQGELIEYLYRCYELSKDEVDASKLCATT